MIACGNCGQSVDASDVTCSHCGALLAAWESVTEAGQSDQQNEKPDYARPSGGTSLLPAVDKPRAVAPPDNRYSGQITTDSPAASSIVDQPTATRLVNTISAADRETASNLVNVIHAYRRKREAESGHARSAASQRQDRSTDENNQTAQISNVVFAIGTVLVVVLVLMWSIVAAMLFSDMQSIEFIAITIVLTLAFKPTMGNLRRIFEK